MNPRERFLAALHREKPDRTPLAHISALTTVELQEATGCRMPQVHHNPAKQAKLLAANHEVLGFDAVTFIVNFFNEPATLGTDMDWGHTTQLPAVHSHPWQQIDDAVIPDDLLERAPVSSYLETLRIAKRDYGGEIAVLGKVMGPFSMTQMMHGVENTMMGNVSTTDLLNATELEIERQVMENLEAGVDIISPGCAIRPRCPNANLQAMARAIDKHYQ